MPANPESLTPPPCEPGKYIHSKTRKPYEVVGVACHSETLKWMVVYKPLYEHEGMPDIWVRPIRNVF